MSAFPTGVPVANSLHDRRNELRTEVAALHGVVSQLQNWVEQLERDRISQVPSVFPDDATFDAAWNTLAGSLLSAVRAETNLGTTSFLFRMRNALQMQTQTFTHYQTSSASAWTITHSVGSNPTVSPARAGCTYVGGLAPSNAPAGSTWWSDELGRAFYARQSDGDGDGPGPSFWTDFNVVVYTWDAGQTVLTQVTPVSVTYPTATTFTITLPASAQGVVKIS